MKGSYKISYKVAILLKLLIDENYELSHTFEQSLVAGLQMRVIMSITHDFDEAVTPCSIGFLEDPISLFG